jgi:hypothetical protein
MNDLTLPQSSDLSPRSLDEAMRLADVLANSTFVPKDCQGKPGNILVAIQWGMEIGLKPMQAMQNIAVINGRPSIWGDAALALVLASPVCDDVVEFYEGTGDDYCAVCIAKRKGKTDKTNKFSIKDAKAAGLSGKQGPWTQYRDRMLKMRARAFSLRDQFTDVLKGIAITEEVMDYSTIEKDITPGKQAPAQIAQQAAATTRPERTERHVEIIARLEKISVELGFEPFKEEWSKLPRDDRAAIGLGERDRIALLAGTAPDPQPAVEDPADDAQRQPGADDE